MSKLISGKEALIALVNGEEVEFKSGDGSYRKLCVNELIGHLELRLKPQTIAINGIDIAKPKKIDLTNIFTITMEFDDHNEAIKANKALKSAFKTQ